MSEKCLVILADNSAEIRKKLMESGYYLPCSINSQRVKWLSYSYDGHDEVREFGEWMFNTIHRNRVRDIIKDAIAREYDVHIFHNVDDFIKFTKHQS